LDGCGGSGGMEGCAMRSIQTVGYYLDRKT
jgi:hypothetical protein